MTQEIDIEKIPSVSSLKKGAPQGIGKSQEEATLRI